MNLKPFRGVQLNRTHPLSKGLSGCWIFNEATGRTVFDLSSNNNQGVLKNGIVWGGSGVDLDGVDGYVDCGNNDSLNFSEGITIVAWIKIDVLGTNKRILAKYSTTQGKRAYQLFVGPDEQIIFNLGVSDGSGGVTSESAHSTISLNKWHCVAATWSIGGTMDLFVDGLEAPTYLSHSTKADAINVNDINMRIGQREESTFPFSGSIRSASVYNCRKSAYEVAWLCREPYAVFSRPRGV